MTGMINNTGKQTMRRNIAAMTVLLAVAVLGGCDQIKPTTGKLPDAVVQASASSSSYVMPHNFDVDDAYVARQMEKESKAIDAAPGFAQRTGNRLVISYDGKSVAEFVAPNAVWTYKGAIRMAGADGKIAPLATVYMDQGEIGTTLLVHRDGRITPLDTDVQASPDGLFIATGYGGTDWGGHMVLIEWSAGEPTKKVMFEANCRPITWQDNAHFTAACSRDEDDSFATVAQISRQADGSWMLAETRNIAWGDENTLMSSDMKLRRETASIIKPEFDNSRRDFQKYGYRKLTP